MKNEDNDNDGLRFTPITSEAEKILSDKFGVTTRFSEVECISDEWRRNLLLRCKCEQPIGTAPPSVIIKQVLAGNSEHNPGEYLPDDLSSWHTKRFYSDWVGAEFLTFVAGDAGHGPIFYGGHREMGFIVLEDLGHEHDSLVEPLLEGNRESAEHRLLAYANRLGKMHSDTVDAINEYRLLASALHPDLMSAQQGVDEINDSAGKLLAYLKEFELEIEPSLEADMQEIVSSVLLPGPFLTYIHRDPCPDNIIFQDSVLRLIDFEFGQMGHALLDIAYGRMIMPTCWCCNRIPESIVAEMESVHRRELAKRCPQAEDDKLFDANMVTVCGYWLLNTLNWLLPQVQEQDDEWGIANIRPRIMARLEAFIEIAEERELLPGYRGTASRLHEDLSKRWPDLEPLPFYPAFRAT